MLAVTRSSFHRAGLTTRISKTRFWAGSLRHLVFIYCIAIAAPSALGGNEDCLVCHRNMEYGEPSAGTERIHDQSGNFLHQPHGNLACTDCHVDITQVPHREGVERKIQCEACHN